MSLVTGELYITGEVYGYTQFKVEYDQLLEPVFIVGGVRFFTNQWKMMYLGESVVAPRTNYLWCKFLCAKDQETIEAWIPNAYVSKLLAE